MAAEFPVLTQHSGIGGCRTGQSPRPYNCLCAVSEALGLQASQGASAQRVTVRIAIWGGKPAVDPSMTFPSYIKCSSLTPQGIF